MNYMGILFTLCGIQIKHNAAHSAFIGTITSRMYVVLRCVMLHFVRDTSACVLWLQSFINNGFLDVSSNSQQDSQLVCHDIYWQWMMYSGGFLFLVNHS